MSQMNSAVIGLGSNIKPEHNILLAKRLLDQLDHLVIEGGTKDLVTEPIGYKQQDNFVNSALKITTVKDIDGLRADLTKIEQTLGRVRTENKNGPRTIDLDVLVWNDRFLDNDVYDYYFLKDFVWQLCPHLDIK